ncbi:NAD-binding protein [Streptomyces parvulus]|uniref:NAD-binding protein n=1 Tax=Streptomyces parvulus TaxID=146923 RepID=A0ABV5DA79_9ACTN|nr:MULTISPECIES: NAD(P)-binding protein [Streptomyces]MCC9153702.1 NAD-binding protein [Streptomyces parvulus]MCE7687365.1 NAD-binding protein [Streptomyces parvulus]MZD57174.1 potassium transporter TrkA [Streptomyces sp. SID5606]WHM35248.1 NAD-binding protein [Streptomyces sp. BPPL-273]WML84626.1 NAD-binding protein [Streptomyces sp. VNUA74]
MVVCGDDGLAHRLAAELRGVYAEQVTLVVPPSGRRVRQPVVGRARAASAALRDMVSAAVNRTGNGEQGGAARELEASEPTEDVLAEAGVERAGALALVYDDDETNIRAALTARRLNPRVRLVLRLYNRRLGQHIEALLDQSAALAVGDGRPLRTDGVESSTTVLSDADTAAPALAATALVGTSKIVETDGLLLRAVERNPPLPGQVADPGLCTLALLSATSNDPAGADGSEDSGEGPQLLPDAAAVRAATGRGTVVLEQVSYSGPSLPAGRASVPPFAELFSRRLRWSLAGLAACVVALAVALMVVTGDHPLHATYVTLLDLFSINEPAHNADSGRQVLQLLSGFVGLLLLPVLLAAVLEALGTFRTATALRKPPRGLGGHVVLLGLGKIGTRVLTRLREMDIPVVCVEADPEARGMATARRLRVPVVLGDVTQEGVLEAAKIHRAHSLLALTSVDTTNLEAVLYGRSVRSGLRVVLRLYDDDFATAVYRTLRAAHPGALTRSRSVTHLAAPSFAGAMMGRQILGAIPVERRVLLFAAVEVAGHPQLEGRTVGEAFRAGAWRVLALEVADGVASGEGEADVDADVEGEVRRGSRLVWELPDTYVLRGEDRVVLAATRRGLAELLGRRTRERFPG